MTDVLPAGSLDGKVALVTGGNGGIGLGMAEALAQAGADIAIWGTNAEKNEAARARLAATGRRILALRCDVGEEAEVESALLLCHRPEHGLNAGRLLLGPGDPLYQGLDLGCRCVA